MDVTKLPFNEFIGLKYSDNPRFLLMLDNRSDYICEHVTHAEINQLMSNSLFPM